uniref:Ovule protein n=2 Tax=Panagrellus redivivus TaxID=6233 RepID=A0A7E4UZU6_PANRE
MIRKCQVQQATKDPTEMQKELHVDFLMPCSKVVEIHSLDICGVSPMAKICAKPRLLFSPNSFQFIQCKFHSSLAAASASRQSRLQQLHSALPSWRSHDDSLRPPSIPAITAQFSAGRHSFSATDASTVKKPPKSNTEANIFI